jgi:hypothetical protein
VRDSEVVATFFKCGYSRKSQKIYIDKRLNVESGLGKSKEEMEWKYQIFGRINPDQDLLLTVRRSKF